MNDPRDLYLAIRYINGWLAQGEVSIHAPPLGQNPHGVPFVIETLVADFEPWLSNRRKGTRDRGLALDRLHNLKSAIGSVLQHRGRVVTEILRCDAGGKNLVMDPRLIHDFTTRDDKPPSHLSVDLGHTDSDGLVAAGSTITAQSLVWKTAILIRELVHTEPGRRGRGSRTAAAGSGQRKSLLDIRLWPKGQRSAASEAVVPVFIDRKAAGGFSIEQQEDDKPLESEHLRWLEIVSFIVGGLIKVCRTAVADPERAFLHEVLLSNQRSRDLDDLLYRFCDWVRVQAGADLVFLLTYDDAKRRFQPRGVSLSQQVCLDNARDWGLPDQADTRLVGRALETKLAPRPRGRSWQIFRDEEHFDLRDLQPLRNDKQNPLDPFYDAFTAMYGRPLRCCPGVAPDGAIWIGYRRKSNAKQAGSRANRGVDPFRSGELDARIERVSHIVASIFAAYRYNPR